MSRTDQSIQWRQRLAEGRDLRRLTDLHVRILLFTQEAIEAGNDQMSHATVAETLKVAVRSVGQAYKRAKVLGLLDWDTQYRDLHGMHRVTVNLYRLAMPEHETDHSEAAWRRHEELGSMSYHEYLQTPEWKHKRRGALNRAAYRCQICNISSDTKATILMVHHRTYENRGRELPSDLIVLCRPCHARHHRYFQAA